jgi:hypothetical protein
MNFYTNVLQWGNQLFVRAVINNERHNFKVKYRPTLFSPVTKHTGYKTLDGVSVLPTEFDSIKEAKEWVDSHKSQPELVYGNTQLQRPY